MTVSHCSSVVSESVASQRTPALRTTMSSPPSRASGLHGRDDLVSLADVGTHEQRARAGRDRRPRSASRPVKTTRAPSSVSRETTASPMPEVPPVTSARWSAWRSIVRN